MRAVKFSLTACVMATMFLGVVVAHAITAQPPNKPVVDGWTTTVFKNLH